LTLYDKSPDYLQKHGRSFPQLRFHNGFVLSTFVSGFSGGAGKKVAARSIQNDDYQIYGSCEEVIVQ
jgi:hypothetical protein